MKIAMLDYGNSLIDLNNCFGVQLMEIFLLSKLFAQPGLRRHYLSWLFATQKLLAFMLDSAKKEMGDVPRISQQGNGIIKLPGPFFDGDTDCPKKSSKDFART